jgi:hypothetical protein
VVSVNGRDITAKKFGHLAGGHAASQMLFKVIHNDSFSGRPEYGFISVRLRRVPFTPGTCQEKSCIACVTLCNKHSISSAPESLSLRLFKRKAEKL